jgi:UDP-GlcNAc3NAcA epimerase
MKILHCIGNRPQYIKLAPLLWKSPKNVDNKILNTGQHYDPEMSSNFINEFKLPLPEWTISPPKQDLGMQFITMIEEVGQIIKLRKFDYAFVYGDTNSTLAATIAASKHNLPVVHIESGLRSRDFNMPEERNRIIVDLNSKIKFAPTHDAFENLKNENLQNESFFVGDLMLDLFMKSNEEIEYSSNCESYILCTIHRKSNLEEKRIKEILEILNTSHFKIKLIVHPALKFILNKLKIGTLGRNIEEIFPQNHKSTLQLLKNAKGVITDSGGLQKESYWMGKPTLIPRTTTEWHETTKEKLCQLDYDLNLINTFIESGKELRPDLNIFGNGDSSQKIWNVLLN